MQRRQVLWGACGSAKDTRTSGTANADTAWRRTRPAKPIAPRRSSCRTSRCRWFYSGKLPTGCTSSTLELQTSVKFQHREKYPSNEPWRHELLPVSGLDNCAQEIADCANLGQLGPGPETSYSWWPRCRLHQLVMFCIGKHDSRADFTEAE